MTRLLQCGSFLENNCAYAPIGLHFGSGDQSVSAEEEGSLEGSLEVEAVMAYEKDDEERIHCRKDGNGHYEHTSKFSEVQTCNEHLIRRAVFARSLIKGENSVHG